MKNLQHRYIFIQDKYQHPYNLILMHKMIKNGNKIRARNLMYKLVDTLEEKYGKPIEEIYELLMNHIYYDTIFVPRRLGAYKYRIPLKITRSLAINKSLQRLYKSAISIKNKPIVNRLYQEIDNSINGQSTTINLINENKKLAKHNQMFAYLLNRKN